MTIPRLLAATPLAPASTRPPPTHPPRTPRLPPHHPTHAPTPMQIPLPTAATPLTTACTTPPPPTTPLYKPDGNKQCEPATSSLADSTRQLTNAGIEVHSS